MSGDERRAFQRFDAGTPARVVLRSGTEIVCRVENAGALGIFLSTAELDGVIEVGDRLTVSFEHSMSSEKSAAAIKRTGEVLRHEQEFTGGEIRRAFAIRFDEPIEV